ncbi:hypothetical protein BKA70DRAFT_1518480 [Coprinopsis sp. MPI-PUGE-AT-0042]|nr:hypothetical protein BKA70DRAFT_1518480 [Coprinopsis sp. MPI-PUGE-AT-0042]
MALLQRVEQVHKQCSNPTRQTTKPTLQTIQGPYESSLYPSSPKEKFDQSTEGDDEECSGVVVLGLAVGNCHVYKAARRREYERLKLLEEGEFEGSGTLPLCSELEYPPSVALQNRAKRQKKKERAREPSSLVTPTLGEEGCRDVNRRGGEAPMKPIKKEEAGEWERDGIQETGRGE